MGLSRPSPSTQQAACLFANLFSACAIVFANKLVLSVVGFKFTVALTCIHTIATYTAAQALSAAGVIVPKQLPRKAVLALASAFTGYIVVCNVSLAVNTVGFYQLTKIAIAPTVLVMESLSKRRVPQLSITLCVAVVCCGISLATLFDKQVMTNVPGLVVGILSIVVSAQYGVWIGSMTKQHDVTPLQLLHQYLPYASALMAVCVPVESALMAMSGRETTTLLTFQYTPRAIGMIVASSILGVMVTFSTFLVIGHTSALTYAIAGHVKTIVILAGGMLFFGDELSRVKTVGVLMALGGVIAYTHIQMAQRLK
jgi:solute carrier family 35 protein E3